MRGLAEGVALMCIAALLAVAVVAQGVPETFTATASVKKGAASASGPVTLTITRYSSEADRAAVIAALQGGGAVRARTMLAAFGDAGFIQLGGRRTAIKFASQRPTDSGRLVTLITAEPILFLGAGIPEAKPRAGFDVAVAMLVLDGNGGRGELAPAAKIGLDDGGALLIEDYGATVVWLEGLTGAR
jgi:hypothetical protein